MHALKRNAYKEFSWPKMILDQDWEIESTQL